MTRVCLTFPARCRYPDIGTAIGTAIGTTTAGTYKIEQWYRVEWPGDRTTWLRAEDIEPVPPDDAFPPILT